MRLRHVGQRAVGTPCYACNIGVEDPRPSTLQRFEYYELVVEHLEALPRGTEFAPPDVWRALGGGYYLANVVKRVIYDMTLHGLLECVDRTRDGRCWVYRVRRDAR